MIDSLVTLDISLFNLILSNDIHISNHSNEINIDENLLHKGYEQYIDFSQNLYKRHQYEMSEVIGSYEFSNEIDLFCSMESHNMKAKAAACYYVVYTDENEKEKRMLSFAWQFAALILVDYSITFDDEETNDFMKYTFDSNSNLYHCLKQQWPFIISLLSNHKQFPLAELFEICFKGACATTNQKPTINYAELLFEFLIEFART